LGNNKKGKIKKSKKNIILQNLYFWSCIYIDRIQTEYKIQKTKKDLPLLKNLGKMALSINLDVKG